MSNFNDQNDQIGNPAWDEQSHKHDIKPPPLSSVPVPYVSPYLNLGPPLRPLRPLAMRPSPTMQPAQLPNFPIASPYATNPTDTNPGVKRKRKSTAVHAPVAPRGTKFHWNDNQHIDQTAFQRGVKQDSKLKLPLKDTEGQTWTFKYPHRKNFDWNSSQDISNADKWRKQIFNRRLKQPIVDNTGAKMMVRPTWSEREKASIEVRILDRIEEKGRRLHMNDFVAITQDHNDAFAGIEIRMGEKLPASLNSAGALIEQGTVRTTHVLQPRTAGAVYSQVMRWPDVRKMMEEEYSKLNDESSSSDSDMPIDDSVGDEFSPVDHSTGMDGYSLMGNMEGYGVMESIEKKTGPTFATYSEEDGVGSEDNDVKYVKSPTGIYITPSPMKSPVKATHKDIAIDPMLESPVKRAFTPIDASLESPVKSTQNPIEPFVDNSSFVAGRANIEEMLLATAALYRTESSSTSTTSTPVDYYHQHAANGDAAK